MSAVPSLFIVADHGRLLAYRHEEEGLPRLVSSTTLTVGGRERRGPMNGSARTAGRAPCPGEREVCGLRRIAEEIDRLLASEEAATWGLCAPPEIHGTIVDFLTPAARDGLVLHVRRQLMSASPRHVLGAFGMSPAPAWRR